MAARKLISFSLLPPEENLRFSNLACTELSVTLVSSEHVLRQMIIALAETYEKPKHHRKIIGLLNGKESIKTIEEKSLRDEKLKVRMSPPQSRSPKEIHTLLKLAARLTAGSKYEDALQVVKKIMDLSAYENVLEKKFVTLCEAPSTEIAVVLETYHQLLLGHLTTPRLAQTLSLYLEKNKLYEKAVLAYPGNCNALYELGKRDFPVQGSISRSTVLKSLSWLVQAFNASSVPEGETTENGLFPLSDNQKKHGLILIGQLCREVEKSECDATSYSPAERHLLAQAYYYLAEADYAKACASSDHKEAAQLLNEADKTAFKARQWDPSYTASTKLLSRIAEDQGFHAKSVFYSRQYTE